MGYLRAGDNLKIYHCGTRYLAYFPEPEIIKASLSDGDMAIIKCLDNNSLYLLFNWSDKWAPCTVEPMVNRQCRGRTIEDIKRGIAIWIDCHRDNKSCSNSSCPYSQMEDKTEFCGTIVAMDALAVINHLEQKLNERGKKSSVEAQTCSYQSNHSELIDAVHSGRLPPIPKYDFKK